MAKLGRPVEGRRPEGYEEACRKVLDNEMSLKDASKSLSVTYAWFCKLFRKDHPNFKPKTDWQRKEAIKLGKSNKKYTTYIEKHFSDYIMCKMIRLTENCDRCPNGASCKGEKKHRGIVKKMLERVPILKGDGKNLEEKDDSIPNA